MKFSCGRCGKKYATAETPAPGRVYKIKCKACGHLIVVKASSAGQQTATTELRPPTSELPAASSPTNGAVDGAGLNLEIAPPEPHAEATPMADVAATPVPGTLPSEPPPRAFVSDLSAPTPAPSNGTPHAARHHDETQEISVSSLQPVATPPPVPNPESGYVDLFGGSEPQKAEAKPEPPPAPVEDPFVAAARASLPDGYGKTSPAPDPFAPLRDELKTPPPEPLAAVSTPSAAAKVPVIARPAQEKSKAPFILIGAGALVLFGILAFVLMGGQKPPAPPPPVASASATPPAPVTPPPAPVTVAQPAPPPPAADPAPVAAAAPEKAEKADKADKAPARASAAEERKARDERRAQEREAKAAREREAKDAREREKAAREARAREERDARDREKAARDAKAREDREARDRDRARQEQEKVAAAGLGEAEGGLSQDQVQKVLSSTRKAFESCIVNAGKSGAVQLDGRRVMLRLNIQTSGAVTYPTLDDVTLNGTDLGSCLKSASRLMVFPKFKGDTMHVEVPLVLAGGK